MDEGVAILGATRRRFVKALIFAFAITAACNFTALLVPLYCMQVYNVVLNTRSTTSLGWLSAGLALAMALFAALDYLRSLLYDVMAEKAARALSLPTLLAAARAMAARGSPRMLAKDAPLPGEALRDLAEIRGFVGGTAISIPLDLLWTPALLVVLFLMHWAYGVFALICGLLLLGLGLLSDMLARRTIEESGNEAIAAFADVANAVRNAEAVMGLGMLPDLAARWRQRQDRQLAESWIGLGHQRNIAAAAKACRLLMTGGMVCLGLVLAIRGDVSGGSLVASNMLLARLLAPIEVLVSSWRAWISTLLAWKRLSALLTDDRNARGDLALPCPHGHLVVERLSYMAPGLDQPILRDLSFEAGPAEILAIIGPSGAGKSTLARLVVGVLQPTSGGVWLDGNNCWQWERGDFGRHVGYAPQATRMLEGTIAENIARMREVDWNEVVRVGRATGLHDAIMRLPAGYATIIGEAGFLLSGGQRQRLAVARALYGRPRLLVLDEPNANLDEDGEQLLARAIADARDDGTTILLITQRPSLVTLADRLIILQDGVITRDGPREQILPDLNRLPIAGGKRRQSLPIS